MLFVSMEQDNISELRATTGLLFILQMLYECGEPRCNDAGRGNLKNSYRNLSQCHFVHHKFHMDWPGSEVGPPR